MSTRRLLHDGGKAVQVLPLFTWLGAFSVDLSSPLRAASSLRYAQRLLQKNDHGDLIFRRGASAGRTSRWRSSRAPINLAAEFAARAARARGDAVDFFREDRPNALVEVRPAVSRIDSAEAGSRAGVQTRPSHA